MCLYLLIVISGIVDSDQSPASAQLWEVHQEDTKLRSEGFVPDPVLPCVLVSPSHT